MLQFTDLFDLVVFNCDSFITPSALWLLAKLAIEELTTFSFLSLQKKEKGRKKQHLQR